MQPNWNRQKPKTLLINICQIGQIGQIGKIDKIMWCCIWLNGYHNLFKSLAGKNNLRQSAGVNDHITGRPPKNRGCIKNHKCVSISGQCNEINLQNRNKGL